MHELLAAGATRAHDTYVTSGRDLCACAWDLLGLAVPCHMVEVAGSDLGMYGTTGVYDPSRTRHTLAAFMYFRVGVTLFRFLVFRWSWRRSSRRN